MKKLIFFMSLIFAGSIYGAVIEPIYNNEELMNDEYQAVQNTYYALKNDSGSRIELIIKSKNGDVIKKIVNANDFTLFGIPKAEIKKFERESPGLKFYYIPIEDIKSVSYYSYGQYLQWTSINHNINLKDLFNNAYHRIQRGAIGFGALPKYQPSSSELITYLDKNKYELDKAQTANPREIAEGRLILLNSLYNQISTVTIKSSGYNYYEEYGVLSGNQLFTDKFMLDLTYHEHTEGVIYKANLLGLNESEEPGKISEEYGKELMSYLNNYKNIKDIFIKTEPKSAIDAARYILDVPSGEINVLSLKYLTHLALIKFNFIKYFIPNEFIEGHNIDRVRINDIGANLEIMEKILRVAFSTLYYNLLATGKTQK